MAEQEQGLTEASASGRTQSLEYVLKKSKKKSELEELKKKFMQEMAELKKEVKSELKVEKMNFMEEIKKIKIEMKELKSEINLLATDLSEKLRKEITEVVTEKFASIMEELHEKIETKVEKEMEPVLEEMVLQSTTIKYLEETVQTNTQTMKTIVKESQRLSDLLAKVTDKCTELEGRQRRQNLRIVGIREGREKNQDTREFTANLLQKVLSLEEKPLIARAHRVMRRYTKHDAPPRQMIVKVQYDYVLEDMMNKVVKSRNLKYEEDSISIYRDYPAEVSKKRNAFKETKRILRQVKNLKYTLRYPATLRVTYNQEEHYFKNPEDALKFAQRIKDREED